MTYSPQFTIFFKTNNKNCLIIIFEFEYMVAQSQSGLYIIVIKMTYNSILRGSSFFFWMTTAYSHFGWFLRIAPNYSSWHWLKHFVIYNINYKLCLSRHCWSTDHTSTRMLNLCRIHVQIDNFCWGHCYFFKLLYKQKRNMIENEKAI